MKVVVVTFEMGPVTQAYVRETELHWPLVVDESRKLYLAFDMHRGRWRDILGPAAWLTYAKLLARGRKLRSSSGDVKQLGGDVLIDPVGIVRLHHVGSGPADRPSISSILEAVTASPVSEL